MAKCGVRITRNVSAGSKTCAAAGATDARRRTLPTSALSVLCGTCGTREHEAEDERRHAEQSRADEEEPVRLDQRTSGCEALHPHAGEPLRELADVRVRRAQERVLRCRVPEAGEAGHVGHERDAGEADAE